MSCKRIKFYSIFILLFFFNGHSFAQNDNTDTNTDSSIIDAEDSVNNDYEITGDTAIIRTLFDENNDSLLKWKQNREFGYMAYLDSLLRKKTDLKIDTISIGKNDGSKRSGTTFSSNESDSNSVLNSFPVKIFFWLIAIFFIGFILYKLFFTGGLFAKQNVKSDNIPAGEPESLNEYSEYNVLIHEAASKNDFNLAIRYLYLQSLKKLSNNELIIFSPDKTNNLYVRELIGRIYQQDFAFLTRNYEYVWYGKFAIDKTQYEKLKEEFISFNKKI